MPETQLRMRLELGADVQLRGGLLEDEEVRRERQRLAELPQLNRRIVGRIRVVAEYREGVEVAPPGSA